MNIGKLSLAAFCTALLAACASAPMGPTVQVLPGATKPFAVFQQDQTECMQYAQAQTAGQADAANRRAMGSAALGTALGAVLGAAIGGNHQGAGMGAAVGAVAGTGAGTNRSAYQEGSIQAQYNNAFVQCMYSKGNQVPGAAR